MRFPHATKLFLLFVFIFSQPCLALASTTIYIHDFKDKEGISAPEFKQFLSAYLTEAGFTCSIDKDSKLPARYSVSGLVEKQKQKTSFSALLTDNYHLEPDVFIKAKQNGGKTSEPAAKKLAGSITALLSNQNIVSVDVSGNERLSSNAIMALAQITPNETATPQKIISARITLDNCGIFNESQLYLTPTKNGRKLKISVKEKEMILNGNISGPGKKKLENILGPPELDLPEFPQLAGNGTSIFQNTNSTGYLAFSAAKIIEDFSQLEDNYPPEKIEELVMLSSAIRNSIYSYENSCSNMCLILMKLCSLLDAESTRSAIENLQKSMQTETDDQAFFDNILTRIEFISQAYTVAQETQLTLASRLYSRKPHSPVIPWVLFSLGKQSLKAEKITKAAPLLAGAISISPLPVSPDMLLTTAKAQYSNLDKASGDAITELLIPLLSQSELKPELRTKIHQLSKWALLCETGTSITDDSFEKQLQKADTLILLDRPDMAEPLFHELHSRRPDDARPFAGFARLAFQRTGELLSARPYIERGAQRTNKDRFFYETALAYKLEKLIKQALPTIKIDGRNSEEASATRFLLPKAVEYAKGYEKINKPQALLLEAGFDTLDKWLAYPTLTDKQALDSLFTETLHLREQMPYQPEIISANYYLSIYAEDRLEACQAISAPLPGITGLSLRFLQLNLLIREMVLEPSDEIEKTMANAARSTFSDAHNRAQAVALQADTHALLGIYRNSTEELKKAASLYGLAADLNAPSYLARLFNNQACVALLLGNLEDADNLYDEALDNNPEYKDAAILGKILSSMKDTEKSAALMSLAEKTDNEIIKKAALTLASVGSKTDSKKPAAQNSTGQNPNPQINTPIKEVLLNETSSVQVNYDNYMGLQLEFDYASNIWLLPLRAVKSNN